MENLNITAFGDCLLPGTYQFHSGFEHIDNFVNTDGDFVSIASDISYLAPNSLIINNFESGKYSQIEVNDTVLKIDKQNYVLNNELRHSSGFIYPEIGNADLEQRVKDFIKFYAPAFPVKSLFFLLYPENTIHFISAFEKAYVQQMTYAYALFQSDLYKSINEFKSRGSGLTPSGDDFIAGVLFGIDFLEMKHRADYSNLKTHIYTLNKTNNLFSCNMLRLAYQAKYYKRLQDFLNAFFYLPLKDVNAAFEQLIAVGDTSGADLLTGYLTVILLPQSTAERI